MLSQQQYDTALANDKIKDGEIYLIPEEDYVTEDEFVAYSTGIINELTNIKNETKTYAEQQANQVKNELLNGAGDAYDTLKELGELIDDNVDAIDALEEIAANKQNKINTLSEIGTVPIVYGTCSTAAGTATKAVSIDTNSKWELVAGSRIAVKFSNTNTASNPTLKVGNTDAKPIFYNTSVITSSYLSRAGYAKRVVEYVYDGENYVFIGWSIDTSYSNATQSSAGLMSAADKKKLDNIVIDTALNSTSTNPVQNKVINNALAEKAITFTTSTTLSNLPIGTTTITDGMTNIKSTDTPIVGIIYSGVDTTDEEYDKELSKIKWIQTGNGQIIVKTKETITSLPIQLMVVR